MLWHLAEDEIRQLLEEKDSKITCKKNIQSRSQVFHEYLLEKGIAEITEKSEIARVLKRF